MRVQWEETDIREGLVVGMPEVQERLMIGFVPGLNNQPALISQSDGQVSLFGDKAAVAKHLNAGWVPMGLLELLRKR
jgi:hypothetical protein